MGGVDFGRLLANMRKEPKRDKRIAAGKRALVKGLLATGE